MNNDFLKLSVEEQLAFIRQAGEQLDMSDMIIEKDFWVCWLLEKIFTLPVQMAFKGGTSLSKVFNLIKRFSEDCDVTIDYHNFQPNLNLAQLSRSQLKKVSDQLKETLKEYIINTVLPYLKKEISNDLPSRIFEITLSEDGEQLRFYYPTVIKASHDYLRDHVLIEFGVRNSTEPCEKYPVTPYLAKTLSKNIFFPELLVNTLSPIRTFWEKATLIHVECHRDRLVQTPERLSRHWYDLYMLNHSWVMAEALSNRKILESVVEHKKAFFNASYANYDECLTGRFRLIPTASYLENLKQDFSKMIEAGMFYEASPSFDEIKVSLENLEILINT